MQRYFDKTKVIPFGISKKDYKINLNLISKYKKNMEKFYFVCRCTKILQRNYFLLDAVRSTNYKLIIAGNGSLYDEIYEQIKIKINNVKKFRKVLIKICHI